MSTSGDSDASKIKTMISPPHLDPDHNKALAHKTKDTVTFLVKPSMQLLDHPPCSPDLAPYDFGLFSEVKKQLKGRRLFSDTELRKAWDQACADLPEEK